MSDKKDNIQLVLLGGHQSYVKPDVKINVSKNWVLNGRNNSFFDEIIRRYNGSPTNAAIINSYVDWILGKGLSATNARVNTEEFLKLKSILKPRELRKIITDFVTFGEFSMQVTKTKGKDLSSITHIPKEKLAPEVINDENEIDGYWFSNDWANTTQNEPINFSAFGTSKDAIEIYNGKPYKSGKIYFSDPEYLAGIPYAEMEEEIANLNISSIKNGLSAGYIINVPDGINLSGEEKQEFERKIKQRLVGSPNASRFVISFNGRDVEITITPFPVNEQIHKQWEFLTEESRQQLMTAHRVISPVLFGIKNNTGLGSNADELEQAREEQMRLTISPKQNFIIDALEEVLTAFGINLDLFFKPLVEPSEVVETPTTELSAHEHVEATGSMADTLIEFGEDLDPKMWALLCSAEVDYQTDDDLFGVLQFASTGVARPNAKSEQDSDDIIIRYRYFGNKSPEREFCMKMMSANKLYRKEDIIQMGSIAVNPGFGAGGTNTYSIWLWKGGGLRSEAFPNGTCRHLWRREIYLKVGGSVDVRSPLAQTISTSEARRRGFKVPVNDSDVSVAPNRNK